ncbi:GNAT family N-acetyltransferase [Sphingobacterium sp. HMA12]|jgi:predicted GNAT family acetyltransferase|uniref:GNAT family N-acetyltransferase n=1 Tax=Sphingobacterium sp. HMA12 TaxID=2050894 RepID=UPI000CE9B082|nr:GNAT family N-acetyltransferase [Sphingobacterium sp. HMA12]
MEVIHKNDEKHGSFEVVDQEKSVAQMTYTWAGPTKFIIDHTEVSENYTGKGLGKQMLMAAVAFARKEHLKILPLCPYAKSVFDKEPELADVLF